MVEQAFNSQHQSLNTPKDLAHPIPVYSLALYAPPSIVPPLNFYVPPVTTHTLSQPLSSGSQVQFGTPDISQPRRSSKEQLNVDSSAVLDRASISNFTGNKKHYSTHVLTKPELHLNTNCCVCASVSRVNPSKLQKICAILQRHMARLERKYGGKRRALTFRLSPLNS